MSSSVELAAMAWQATSVLLFSAHFWMRKSMLVVMSDPFGCTGKTTFEYELTVTVLGLIVAELERTLVILKTWMWLLSYVSISHIGSPDFESCMTVGRRLKALLTSFW